MKKTNKLLSLVLVFAIVFMMGIKGTFAAPKSITLRRAETTSDLVTGRERGFTMFETTDGTIVYCMDVSKKPLATGDTAYLVGDADGGETWILMNGYPKKYITSKNEADQYITQATMWWYVDENSLSDEFKNPGDTDVYNLVPKYIKPMVSKARGNANYKTGNVTLSNSSISASMHLTSDGKYYESDAMKITLTNADKYTVSVNNGTAISTSGKVQNTFASGESFKIRLDASNVTTDTKVNVKVSATGQVDEAKIYKTNDSSKQRVVGLFKEDKTAVKEFNLTAYAKKTVCKYTNGKYYDKNGNVTDKDTYTKECKKVCVYENGKYYDKEGNITNKKTYQSECSHTCEVKDGKYYGIDGTVTDKNTYDKECSHTCEFYGGRYYGKNGNAVDENTYKSECNKTCTYSDNNYYGKSGDIVDKGTYESECGQGQEVVSPNTSSNVSPFMIIGGLMSVLAGAFILAIRGKFILG